MPSILAVGIATIDIINEVPYYPTEDNEIRAIGQSIQRGGNATNSLVVLSQLGHSCSWAGTLADDINKDIILSDLQRYNINKSNISLIQHATNPTSYISQALDTSSRNIIHYRNLSEYNFASFAKIDLSQFDWIHFEGRNVDEVYKMQQLCKQTCPNIPVSVEIEKNRKSIDKLFQYPDVILCSKPYANSHGYDSVKSFLYSMSQQMRHKIISCTWGEAGADLFYQGQLFSNPAFKPKKLIETLAAGDTYNAAIIHALLKRGLFSSSANEILDYACQLAGEKCAQKGLHFEHIKTLS